MPKIPILREERETWLKSLKANKGYRQANSVLYSKDKGSFCCLGVFCDLKQVNLDNMIGNPFPNKNSIAKNIEASEFIKHSVDYKYPMSYTEFNDIIKSGKVIDNIDEILKNITIKSYSSFLATLNDLKMSFKEIAHVIEKTSYPVDTIEETKTTL